MTKDELIKKVQEVVGLELKEAPYSPGRARLNFFGPTGVHVLSITLYESREDGWIVGGTSEVLPCQQWAKVFGYT